MKKYLLCLLVLAACPAAYSAWTVNIMWDSVYDIDAWQHNLTMMGPGRINANTLWSVTRRTPTGSAYNPVMNNAGYWEDDDGDPDTLDVWVPDPARFAEAKVLYAAGTNLATAMASGDMEAWAELTDGVWIEPQSGKRLIQYVLDKAPGVTLPDGDYLLTLTNYKGTFYGMRLIAEVDTTTITVSDGVVPAQTTSLNILFIIPEPSGIFLVLVASALFLRRR